MNIPTLRWLLAQLPQWQATGLLTPSATTKIRAKYTRELHQYDRTSTVSIPIAIIAVLALAAAWLLFDRWDWTTLPTPIQLIIATAPWLLTSAALLWAHTSHTHLAQLSDTKEASALLLILGSAATIAMLTIIPATGLGEATLSQRLAAWLAIQVPLLPITRSVVLMFAILFACVLNYRIIDFDMPAFWLLLLLWSAYAVTQMRQLREQMPRIAVLCLWAFALNLALSTYLELMLSDTTASPLEYNTSEERELVFDRASPSITTMSFFFATMAAIGRLYLGRFARHFAYRLSSRPLEVIGSVGTVAILWITQRTTSYKIPLGEATPQPLRFLELYSTLSTSGLLIVAVSLVAWAAAAHQLLNRRDYRLAPFMIAPLMTLGCYALGNAGLSSDIIQWTLLLYLTFAVAAWMIVLGGQTGRYIVVDSGVILLIVCVANIFFDTLYLGDIKQALLMLVFAALILAAHFGYFRKKIVATPPA